jgi:hypothetical protein
MIKLINILREIGDNLNAAYDFKYVGGTNPTYTFTTGETPYKVVFRDEGEGLYELIYTPIDSKAFKKDPLVKKYSNTMTAEYKAIPINATVTAIMLDFLNNNKDWHTITVHPIDERRYRLIARFFYNNLPKSKYNIEEIEGIINVTRKI